MNLFNPDKPYTGTGEDKNEKTNLRPTIRPVFRDKSGKVVKPFKDNQPKGKGRKG